MNKIVVKHSCIEINDYTLGDSPKLEYMFTIYDPLYHTTYFKGIEYREEEKKLILPRGMDIFLLERIFMTQAYIDYKHDPYDHTEPIMISYLPRNEVQKTALRFILGEGEYKYTQTRSALSVNLNTGGGKTYVSIAAISFLCIKSIVITSSIKWLEQWKDRILEYTDILPNEIYMITGAPSIQSLLKGRKDVSKFKIFLASHSTIKSYGDKYGWDQVGELFKILRVGIKIYDEAHLNFDNIYRIDYNTNTFKTIYLTATPARSNREENDIFQIYHKNIPAIDLFDEENDPRTQYMAFRYNSHPEPMDITRCKNQYGFDRNKYVSYVVNQENFYNMLHVLIDIIKYRLGKVLIYIGINECIDIVYHWIIENYPELSNDIGIYNGKTDEKEKAKVLNKKIILSNTKTAGAAMDIKDLKMTIVLAEPFKSSVLARQTLGRTRDQNTYYIDIVDDGFYYTKRYYAQKKPVFEKYATKCIETTFTDIDLEQRVEKIMDFREKSVRPIQYLE